MASLPRSVSDTLSLLTAGKYVSDRSLATAIYLALTLGRPLFLEGEAGVGKTEIAKVLSETLGRRLIRLQCYEGLDVASAVYEWNYARQMIEIRLAESGRESKDTVEEEIFTDRFLIKRPLLQVLESTDGVPPVLLIDASGRVVLANKAMRAVIGLDAEKKPVAAVLRTPSVLEAVERTRISGEPGSIAFTVHVRVERNYEAHVARVGTEPPLTALDLHLDRVAVLGVELLLARMRGGKSRNSVPAPLPTLVPRLSSAKPR